MNKIDLRAIIKERYPKLSNYPVVVRNLLFNLVEKIMIVKEINNFLRLYSDKKGIDFIDAVFEHLNFSFTISNKDLKKIPSEGRLICVANHPIGSLDALALMKLIYEIRRDIMVVANDILYNIPNLREFMLPFELDSVRVQRNNIKAIGQALEKEKAIIIFPAAEVSRLKGLTVTDGKWHKGAVYFARRHNSSILPVKVGAKNSAFFYFMSLLNKNFSRVFLVKELFNKKNKTISLKIGDPIPAKAFSSSVLSDATVIKLLKKHVYSLGKNKKSIFKTEKNIIHPIDRKLIKKEISRSEQLGITPDNKKIVLTSYEESPNVLNEIGRLREVTFRKVGEGTGAKMDIDEFDKYYKHLVVWDDEELEIVGAYRIGIGKEILQNKTHKGFYVSSLFSLNERFVQNYLDNSIELGRSFIQKKYWNTNALHYLWLGIGSYIAKHNDIKYLFGPVSISNNYPDITKQMIVYYYNKWYGCNDNLAISKNRFRISSKDISDIFNDFTRQSAEEDFKILKNSLKQYGYTVPILYKHYSNLCEKDGVKFLDFGIDPDFNNCVDGLILIDIDKLKSDKKDRYVNYFTKQECEVEV